MSTMHAEQYERHKQRAAETQRAIAAAGKDIGPIPSVFNPERRARYEQDLKGWVETYCERAVRLGWSADHLELLDALESVLLYGGQLAVGMPRGTGKTTLVSLSVLWAILYGHHRFLAVIAATDPKARKLLAGIKKQIEINELLLEDFPEVCFPVRCLGGVINRQSGQTSNGKNTNINWSKEEVHFPTIEGSPSSGALIVVGGITGAIARGPQHTLDDGEIIRPSVALIDDFQTRESAKSPDQTQTRLDIIEADIAGMAGPDIGCDMLATVTVIYPNDGADRLLDVDKNPSWGGIRKKFLLSFPERMDLWEKYKEIRRESLRTYRDIRLATQFYADNRAEMDRGARVSWEARFRRKTRTIDDKEVEVQEISAIQHAMEWFLIKPHAFASELQNDPQEANQHSRNWLSAKDIELKVHHAPAFIVPQVLFRPYKLVEHLDVHDDLLYWTVAALARTENGGEGRIIAYSTYPEQGMRYFAKHSASRKMQDVHPKLALSGAIRASIMQHCRDHLDRTFIGEDGITEYQLDLLLIDCGHEDKIVNACVLELNRIPRYRNRIMKCRGRGVKATELPINHPNANRPENTQFGNNCYALPTNPDKLEAPCLMVDVNYWKTQTHDRWATPIGEPGSLSLFAGGDHQGFAEQQTAETATEVNANGRTVFEFKLVDKSRDNHWFDNTDNLLAGGSLIGCDTPANFTPRPKKRKRRRRKVTVKL